MLSSMRKMQAGAMCGPRMHDGATCSTLHRHDMVPCHSLVAAAPGLHPRAERGAAVGGGQAASLWEGGEGQWAKDVQVHNGMAWHGTPCHAMR